MTDKYHRKPFTYEIKSESFDINHQLGVAVSLHAQMPNMDVRQFRHAVRVPRIDGPYTTIDPKALGLAVEEAAEQVNLKYWDAVHAHQRDIIKGENQ